MKENFPNLSKEIDFQEVQEAQRVPKKLDPRSDTPRHIIITLAKIKNKERVLEHTQTHPPRNQHQKGPICLWVLGEVTESGARA